MAGRLRWVSVSSLLYLGAVIFGLDLIGYWRTDLIGETVLWFLSGAALAMPRALSVRRVGLKLAARRFLAITAGLVFLANVHTFSLPIELLLVPVLCLVGGMTSLVDVDPDLDDARKAATVLSNVAAFSMIGLSIVYIAIHLARYETPDYLRALLLPVILAAVTAPLIYAIRLVVLWSSALNMLRGTYLKDRPELYRYIRRRCFQLCGLSLKRADLFEKDYWRRLRGAQNETEVESVLCDFASASMKQENPKAVEDAIEWDDALGSSFDLQGFLAKAISSASLKQQELDKAAESSGIPKSELVALADRLDADHRLSATSPIVRAQMIRALADQSRSVAEIELMAPEIAQLATLEGVDARWLSMRFDAVLTAWGNAAEESNAVVSELHAFASNTPVSLADVIIASIAMAQWDGTLPETAQ